MLKTLSMIISTALLTVSIHGAIQVNKTLGKQIPHGAVQYNLVEGLSDIYLDPSSEKIDCTWKNASVYTKSLMRRLYSLLAEYNEPLVVIDVGAQTGCFSLLAKYLPDSQWYSFEPLEEAAEILEANLFLNEIQNVSVYQKAAHDSSSQRMTSIGERKVECIDMDSFIAANPIRKVHFMRLDAEGSELYVLQGAKNLIMRDHPTLLMKFKQTNMSQYGGKETSLLEFLRAMNYQVEFLDGTENILCTPKPDEKIQIMLEWTGDGAGMFSNLMRLAEWLYCVKQNELFGIYINMNQSYGFKGNIFPALFKQFRDPKIFTARPNGHAMHLFEHFPRFFPRSYPSLGSNLIRYPTDGMKHYHQDHYVYNDPDLFSDADFILFRERLNPMILKYLQPLPELQERIDIIAEKMNHPNTGSQTIETNSSNLPTVKIGIHVRCLIHYLYNNLSPDQFIDDVERDIDQMMKSKDPSRTQIFLATLLEPLVDRLSSKYNVVVCNIPRVPDVTSDWGYNEATCDLDAARNVIVDTWCLAQCDELWGTSSNMTIFAACLNPKLKIYMLPSLRNFKGA